MKDIMDFLSAALPWISIGLLLAIFFAQNARKKKDNKKKENYGTEGMALGMCFGTAIGTSFGNNTGIGLSLGMLAGLVIGSCIEKKKNDDGEQMNQKIHLQPMDRMLLHEYYKGFVMDADIFMDMGNFREYTYAPERVDAYFDKLQSQKDRLDFLIMNDEKPIGEIALKHIDETTRQCELSIHLQNDSVKNKGYGTQAERLILEYAFQTLGMKTVIADSVLKNKRSQHTLEKVGFQETGRDDTFVYYIISQSDWLKLGDEQL